MNSSTKNGFAKFAVYTLCLILIGISSLSLACQGDMASKSKKEGCHQAQEKHGHTNEVATNEDDSASNCLLCQSRICLTFFSVFIESADIKKVFTSFLYSKKEAFLFVLHKKYINTTFAKVWISAVTSSWHAIFSVFLL